MAHELTEVETEAERAEKACDGVELLAAFCSIEDRQLRKAVKRIVLALCGGAATAPWIDPDIVAEASMLLDVLPTGERGQRPPR